MGAFTGTGKENSQEHRAAFESTLAFFNIDPTTADGRPIAYRLFASSLREKPLQWLKDNYAACPNAANWGTMLTAFVREFHPLGKSQIEWDVAWNSIRRQDYPSLLKFAEKVKEMQRLLGKTEEEVVNKIKLYATNAEHTAIGAAADWNALETALKEYAAREQIAGISSGMHHTTPAVPFMMAQESQDQVMHTAMLNKVADAVAKLTDKIEQLNVTTDTWNNTKKNGDRKSRDKEKRRDGKYQNRPQSGSKSRTPSVERPYGQNVSWHDKRQRTPSNERRPQNGYYLRCEICNNKGHHFNQCPMKMHVHAVESKYGYQRYRNGNGYKPYQGQQRRPPRQSTPKPDYEDKINFIYETMQSHTSHQEDECEDSLNY